MTPNSYGPAGADERILIRFNEANGTDCPRATTSSRLLHRSLST